MIVNKEKGIIQIDLIIEKIMVVQHIIGFILTLILKVHVCFCVILIVNSIRKKYFQEKAGKKAFIFCKIENINHI